MRLLIYYKPKKEKFVLRYNQDRHHELKLDSINHYGHIIIQYWYIEDKKIFFDYKKYQKYRNRNIKKPSLRYRIGQALINKGLKLCFGTTDRNIFIKRNQWWKKDNNVNYYRYWDK